MGFRKKIVLLYVVLGLFTAALFGVGYYTISMRQEMDDEYRNISLMAYQYEQMWTEYTRPMDSIMSYILSDPEIIRALRTLGTTDREDPSKMKTRKDSTDVISKKIVSDYSLKNFYRVILFNEFGDVVANNDFGSTVIRKDINIEDIPWLSEVAHSNGRNIMLGCHKDDWGMKERPDVFSVVKEIQGMHMGYIEVQKCCSELDDVFQVVNEDVQLMIIDSKGETLYSNNPDADSEFYSRYAVEAAEGVATVINTMTGGEEVIAVEKSGDGRVSIVVSCELSRIKRRIAYINSITVLLVVSIFLLSFWYVWISSKYLTRPIYQLKKYMDDTRIENMKDERKLITTNDEIEMLSESYKEMLERLNMSLVREKRLSFLQLQAQYDLIQAQINPHFIYNVLNVIANRGIENEDEEICELCDSLAQMLRYSTGTKERYVTVRDELEYIQKYFYLLHSRYEYRLKYQIDVAPEIYGQILPKITLQQIVENAVYHGYKDTDRSMHIAVSGGVREQCWYIEIADNGEGFSDGIRQELLRKMEEIKEKLIREEDSVELEIGGMGLVNTYARLYLIYRDNLDFQIIDSKEGAAVVISAPMSTEIDCFVPGTGKENDMS